MIKIAVIGASLAFATPAFAQPWDGWEDPFPDFIPAPAPEYHPRPHIKKPVTPLLKPVPKHIETHVFDKTVNFQQTSSIIIMNPVGENLGTIVIDTKTRRLYLVQDGGTAIRYKIAVGKIGFSWKGMTEIRNMAHWPAWHPPKAMIERRPELPEMMEGGPTNPLGARAMYLFNGKKDTLFRIHGTNEPSSIGKPVSSGCFRMFNADAIDLFNRVNIGTKVIVR